MPTFDPIAFALTAVIALGVFHVWKTRRLERAVDRAELDAHDAQVRLKEHAGGYAQGYQDGTENGRRQAEHDLGIQAGRRADAAYDQGFQDGYQACLVEHGLDVQAVDVRTIKLTA